MGKNVYLNGRILPAEKAKINITDRGFLYGDGLVETLRTYKRVPFMLRSHLTRLLESAQDLEINIKQSIDQLKDAVFSLIEANEELERAVIRITLTRGDSKKRSLFEVIDEPNLLITMAPLDEDEIKKAQSGVSAISGEDKRSLVSNHKNSSMLASVVSYKQALDQGAFDIIQVTKRGFVTEASRCNVFVVLENILFTPPAGVQVLAGITRRLAINIANRNGIRVEEDAIVKQDLSSAEEIFLTNSLFEVVPVSTLNTEPIGNGKPGLITTQIQKEYRQLIEKWLEQLQIKAPV